jgi:demethylmenaquinone methyltransferase/2-methoxy-6-polyprenyl-1,4-benzoquinol methylase
MLKPSRLLRPVLLRFYLGQIVPLLSGVAASQDSMRLMAYYWDTIEVHVPPARVLDTCNP